MESRGEVVLEVGWRGMFVEAKGMALSGGNESGLGSSVGDIGEF